MCRFTTGRTDGARRRAVQSKPRALRGVSRRVVGAAAKAAAPTRICSGRLRGRDPVRPREPRAERGATFGRRAFARHLPVLAKLGDFRSRGHREHSAAEPQPCVILSRVDGEGPSPMPLGRSFAVYAAQDDTWLRLCRTVVPAAPYTIRMPAQ